MNYTKFYKEQLSISWDSSRFEVHHIDCNRCNNDIKNLVLLPITLHKAYHQVKPNAHSFYEYIQDNFIPEFVQMTFIGEYQDVHSKYIQCLRDMSYWLSLRDALLYKIADVEDIQKIINTFKM